MSPKIHVANPNDKAFYSHSFVLWFGAYGWTRVLVYASDLESALEEAAGYLADNYPGLIMKHDSEELKDLYKEACEELGAPYPPTEENWEKVDEKALIDLTYTESGCIPSWEWGISAEDPTKEDLIEMSKP